MDSLSPEGSESPYPPPVLRDIAALRCAALRCRPNWISSCTPLNDDDGPGSRLCCGRHSSVRCDAHTGPPSPIPYSPSSCSTAIHSVTARFLNLDLDPTRASSLHGHCMQTQYRAFPCPERKRRLNDSTVFVVVCRVPKERHQRQMAEAT